MVATRMEDGQGLKGSLSLTPFSTASLPSPSDPGLSLASSSGLCLFQYTSYVTWPKSSLSVTAQAYFVQ